MRPPSLDDPDLPLAELMSQWPEMVQVFLRHHMLCVGCSVSPFHTLRDACHEYHLEEAAFRAELHESLRAAL
jgi:hybrid cluster-associated redox disulfide protein